MAKPTKVLIIDDSADDQLLYQRSLTKGTDGAYEILCAESGDEAFARLDDFAPDCILLDYSLPGHNGIEVLKRLRATHPFTAVAMLTGQGNETVAVAAMQQGAQHYISKSSITPEALQRAIGVAIEHCGMQRRIHSQVERLNLLHQITRAIGERQDLDSILQVVVRALEDRLPVEFASVCQYNRTDKTLVMARAGAKNEALVKELMSGGAKVAIEAEIEQAIAGEFVYEPEAANAKSSFTRKLAAAGLNSFMLAPLQVQGEAFGIVVVARTAVDGFNEGDREFLHQLSEHVALAAHQVQLYGALQQAYDKLRETQQVVMQQERLRAVGTMASGIAHDINNALSPVALYTQSLLEGDENLSPRARSYLETTQRAIEDVAHTVARLRDFYRQREQQAPHTPVQLNQLAQHAIDLTRARWSDMSMKAGVVIKVKPDLARDLPSVMGAEPEIREALVNLILNAVDAMPEGGDITVRTTFSGKTARLEVADTGAGMTEETRRRCLEPFFTTKGERGTGLGLAMVYGIAQRHNAGIEIESTLGKGTTVSMVFRLPEVVEAAPKQAAASTGPTKKHNLLLVDDDPLVLQSLRTTLEIEGHKVTTANDGQKGIDTFKAEHERGNKFSVVVTDLGMPHVDGRKVAAAIKAISPATPILLLTGWGQGMTQEETPQHVDGVLGKPPRLRDLRAALAAAADQAPAEKISKTA